MADGRTLPRVGLVIDGDRTCRVLLAAIELALADEDQPRDDVLCLLNLRDRLEDARTRLGRKERRR